MEVIVKGQPSIEIGFETKVIQVGGLGDIDSSLSTTSENPVMNKVVTAELNQKATKTELSALDTKVTETDEKLTELSAEINGNADFVVPTKAGVGLGLNEKHSIELVQGDASVLLIDDDGVLNVSYVTLFFYGDDQNNNIFSIGINKDIYKTFTLPQNTKSFAVYAAANTIVKDGQIVLKFKDNDGLQKGIRDEIAILKENNESIVNEVEYLSENIEKIESSFVTQVDDFYQTAWVRYSDGYIAHSSGGAKLYKVRRKDYPNATKITAKVCTQQTTFAAIAFYSTEEPSTSSYIKEASVQGIDSKESHTFTADIPSDCECIIILNMSQLQPSYYIALNEVPFISKTEGKGIIADSFPIVNPFSEKDMYYHFNQENEASNTYIPAQSLADIDFAAKLGFNMIEANIHACSDGVFLCKHGSAGKFGNGIKSDDGVDYANVLISSISSEYARQHITYNSLRAKYNTPIPTLDEFAATCKKYNLAIKVEYADGVLPLLRKYFTDDKLFFTQMESRGDFKGLIEVIWNPTKNMTDFEKKCKDLGQPLQIIIQSGYWDELTTEQIEGIVSFSHERGYTLAVPYLLASQWVSAKAMGVDVNLSCYASIPSFSVGNRKNISSLKDAELIKEGGATYDEDNDIIIMPKGSTIRVSAESIILGAVSVDMMYKGDITLVFGQSAGTRNVTCASSNYGLLSYASAIYPQSSGSFYSNEYVRIIANEETRLQSIYIKCSDL